MSELERDNRNEDSVTADETMTVEAGEPAEAGETEIVQENADSVDSAEDFVDIERVLARVSEMETEIEEAKNRYIRLQADFDNYRRRTRQEMELLSETAAEKLIGKLLPVLDNLERALQSASQDGALEHPIVDGVEMVLRQLRSVLESEGLKPIPAVGEQFNPEIHEAVSSVEMERAELQELVGERASEILAEGFVVVEEFQKGYYLGPKVLRTSMVKVARVKPGSDIDAGSE